MLYKFSSNEELKPMPYNDVRLEKDLENILAKHLNDLFFEEAPLMTIFQERPGQEEPDICALDREGNLILFELKRAGVSEDTTLQIMRYSQKYGRMNYYDLNNLFKKYPDNEDGLELSIAHKEAFDLPNELEPNMFNRRQRLLIVGSSSSVALMYAVDYWRRQGVDIDFIPYRIYEINGESYFELFSKPYDYHLNPSKRKGIIFDSNRSHDNDALFYMLKEERISAFGRVANCVNYFSKNDYVLYYHSGFGSVAAGKIKDVKSTEKKGGQCIELFRKVQLLTPKISCEEDIRCISKVELERLLGKEFFYAKTTKVPYLTSEECTKIIEELNKRYNK